jgi:hypothetical protein
MNTGGQVRKDGWVEGLGSLLLLVAGASTVLIAPLFPDSMYAIVYNVHVTAILVAAVMAFKEHRRQILVVALAISVLDVAATATGGDTLRTVGRTLNVFFFWYIVGRLIVTIMRTRRVTMLVLLQAVNGYLMLGLALGFVAAIIAIYNPEAYSFGKDSSPLGEIMYHSFITFTTVGYGDFVPVGKFARSLAVLTGFSGQLYVAIVIAMLVGKFAGGSREQ